MAEAASIPPNHSCPDELCASARYTKCVVCTTDKLRRPKLLTGCLHAVCGECVQGIVSRQGTVKCPRCQSVTSLPAGVSVLDGLPDYFGSDAAQQPSGGTDGTDNLDAKHLCDECVEGSEEEATVYCAQCQAAFCKLHERAHLQSRRTAKHDVERLSGANTRASVAQSGPLLPTCPLHTSYKLTKYCTTCRELLCERCEELGSHRSQSAVLDASGGHSIIDCVTAGEQERAKLREVLFSSKVEEHTAAKRARLCLVKEKISEVNAMSERESAKVTEATDRLVEQLRAEERSNLDKIDSLRWKKLKVLEKLEAEDSDALEAAEQCHHLTEEAVKSLGPGQLLQVSDVLRKTLSKTMSAENQRGVSVPHLVMTFKSREPAIKENIQQGLGDVTCASVGPSRCTAQLSNGSTRLNEGVSVLVTLKDEHGAFLPAQSIDDIAHSVCGEVHSTSASSSESAAVTLEFARFQDNQLKADFVPQQAGEFVVTVKIGDQEVDHSALRLKSEAEEEEEEGWTFCAKTCSEKAVLSNRNKTARKKDDSYGDAYVYFSTGFARGKHSWRFIVDGIDNKYSAFFGVHHFSNQEKAQESPSRNTYDGACVGQRELSMQSKDLLHCEFSCDDRMLTVTNERTMMAITKRMRSPKLEASWFVPYFYLFAPPHSFTIVS